MLNTPALTLSFLPPLGLPCLMQLWVEPAVHWYACTPADCAHKDMAVCLQHEKPLPNTLRTSLLHTTHTHTRTQHTQTHTSFFAIQRLNKGHHVHTGQNTTAKPCTTSTTSTLFQNKSALLFTGEDPHTNLGRWCFSSRYKLTRLSRYTYIYIQYISTSIPIYRYIDIDISIDLDISGYVYRYI